MKRSCKPNAKHTLQHTPQLLLSCREVKSALRIAYCSSPPTRIVCAVQKLQHLHHYKLMKKNQLLY
jgi:hypothetical protein